jgi:hypothetical protein
VRDLPAYVLNEVRVLDDTRENPDEFLTLCASASVPVGAQCSAGFEIVQSRLPGDQPPVIRVVGEDIIAERDAVVRTEVQARYGDDIQLDYLMTSSDKGWLVRDIVIDGVTLVENCRAQFARILRTSSYADLVRRLRTMAGARTSGPIAARPSFEIIVAYFDTSRAELSPAARRDLDRAATWLTTDGRASSSRAIRTSGETSG